MTRQAQNPQSGTGGGLSPSVLKAPECFIDAQERLLELCWQRGQPSRIIPHNLSSPPHRTRRDTKFSCRRQPARSLRGAVKGTMTLAVQAGKRGARVRERYTDGPDDRRGAFRQRPPLTTGPHFSLSKRLSTAVSRVALLTRLRA